MSDEQTLEERVEDFLRRNIPQIQMHGGSAAIHADEDEGVVHITLGGACTGCGLKPMTMKAIKRQLIEGVPEVTDVRLGTHTPDSHAQSADLALPEDDPVDADDPDAPF